MDLLEIRKKAKKQKAAQAESVPAARSPEPAPASVSEQPKSKTAAAEPESKSDDFSSADFESFLLHQSDNEPDPITVPAPVSKAPPAQAVAMNKPAPVPAPQIDTEIYSQALAPIAAGAAEVDAAGGFLDLATEALYRHSYLDNTEAEDVAQCEILMAKLADEDYGINIHRIKEIIKIREITEVPRAPSFIRGIITLRGRVIPVFDLRERLGLESRPFGRESKIVVVHNREELYGLIVDAVIDVARFPLNSIEATPPIMVGVEAKYIEGIGRVGDQMIILLNLDEVLNLETAIA